MKGSTLLILMQGRNVARVGFVSGSLRLACHWHAGSLWPRAAFQSSLEIFNIDQIVMI